MSGSSLFPASLCSWASLCLSRALRNLNNKYSISSLQKLTRLTTALFHTLSTRCQRFYQLLRRLTHVHAYLWGRSTSDTPRCSTPHALTRSTRILFIGFITSVLLTKLAGYGLNRCLAVIYTEVYVRKPSRGLFIGESVQETSLHRRDTHGASRTSSRRQPPAPTDHYLPNRARPVSRRVATIAFTISLQWSEWLVWWDDIYKLTPIIHNVQVPSKMYHYYA